MTASGRPSQRRAKAFVLVGLAVGAVLIGLQIRQGAEASKAVGGVAILVAFLTAVWFFQTRSELASTLAGRPVDERWELIHSRSTTASMAIGMVVAIAGTAVTEAQGRDNWQFMLMAVVLSFGYIAALFWYRLRY